MLTVRIPPTRSSINNTGPLVNVLNVTENVSPRVRLPESVGYVVSSENTTTGPTSVTLNTRVDPMKTSIESTVGH